MLSDLIEGVENILTSQLFWEVRVISLAVSLLFIWKVFEMSYETILWLPVEYMPVVVGISFLLTFGLTMLKGILACQEASKAKLATGEITAPIKYSMDYLAANIANVIVGVFASLLISGGAYAAFDAQANLAGVVILTLVTSVIIGVWGVTCMSDVIDMFRNKLKIAKLVKDNSSEESQPASLSELNKH